MTVATNPVELPPNHYTVIAADPPWTFNNNGLRDGSNTHYGELTLDDLKALGPGVRYVAAQDCVLLLWGVPALVPEAVELVKAWGFDYVTMIPWFKLTKSSADDLSAKMEQFAQARPFASVQPNFLTTIDPNLLRPSYGMGWWARGAFEPLLIAKRGNPRQLPGFVPAHNVGLISQNFSHSRKPDNVYDYANQFPGPKLELFARREVPAGLRPDDWTVVGDEIDGRDIRDVLTP